MATLSIPHSFVPGTPALASEVNANFQAVVSWTQGQISTDNFGILGARSVALPSSPTLAILSLAQTSSNIALNISNSGTESAIAISQSGALANGKGAILINSPSNQTTSGAAELLMTLNTNSSIPAILVNHGAVQTMSLTRTQLNLYASAIELNNTRIKVPVRTTTQRNAVTQEGSVLYNSDKKELAFRTDSTWIPASTPTGCVQMFAGSAAPQGWLLCDGTEYAKSNYPDLDAILSVGGTYPYGQTNGSGGAGTTHFRTPDCRGIFVRGAGSQTISGETYSATLGAKQQDATSKNGLTLTDPGHQHFPLDPVTAPPGYVLQNFAIAVSAGAVAFLGYGFVPNGTYKTESVTTGVTLGNGDSETRPANIAMNYIIKT